MNAWQHLPNASHIDWVIGSVKTHSREWADAHNAARDAARAEAWNAAWNAARDAALDADRSAAWNAALDAARDAAWEVILALVAYDDCDQYLSMSYEQLLTYAILSERPQAVLLLPLKWIQENETLVTLA